MIKIISFVLAGERYGIKVNNIIQMLEVPKNIGEIPNTKDFIEGVINLRGNIVPILNIAKKFDLKQKEIDEETKIIVLEEKDELVGILVDEIKEVIKIEEKDIESAPDMVTGIPEEAFIGLVEYDEEVLILIDINIVLEMER